MCVRSIPVRHGGPRVLLRALGPFPCALGVVGFFRACSVHSSAPRVSSGSIPYVRSIPMRHGGRQVRSGAFVPFPYALGVVGFLRVCSVHFHARWGSSGSIRCVSSNLLHPGAGPVLSSAFPCFLGVVLLVCVRSVHSRAPRVSLVCVRSIPLRPGGRQLRSCAFGL